MRRPPRSDRSPGLARKRDEAFEPTGEVRHVPARGRDRFGRAGDPRGRLKLPDGVQCYAIAATKSRGAGGKLSGDGLVPVDSALGRHAKPKLTLGFPETHQWIAYAMAHLDVLSRAEVYETIRSWLSS